MSHEGKVSAVRFSREILERFSKHELIDIVLLQQQQLEWLQRQVESLTNQVTRQQQRIRDLERRLGADSRNSSLPPSRDFPGLARPGKKPSKRKPGGQPGHEASFRGLLPVAEVDEVIVLKPERCRCGRRRHGRDSKPRRHQVWEMPEIRPKVTEYQLHALDCAGCGKSTAAKLPPGIPTGAFGARLQATVAIFTGVYHLSKRAIAQVMADIFNIPISLGAIPSCEATASHALREPAAEAWNHAQTAAVLHADETGWREQRKKAWLWTAVTGTATVFMIHAPRGQEAARRLLGAFSGTLVSDRWSAYNIHTGRRQLCWAHLKRDFTGFSELHGARGKLGAALLAQVDLLFHGWHRVRDGTWQRKTFQRQRPSRQAKVEALLRQGTVCGDKTMQRVCKRILKQSEFLWTFVAIEGVEPTNNSAERQIRQGVLWRKISLGTQSPEGSRFVERIMTATATATCRQQGRNVVAYITEACQAYLHGQSAPSLLPRQ